MDGPYSQGYDYDVWGNVTHKYGWGGEVQGGTAGQNGPDINRTYTNNRVNGFSYDAAGNLTNDLGQTFTYDATGQQATASYGGYSLTQSYDGDGLRVKKNDNGAQTYYLRSSVLGGQVVAEIIWASVSWQWNRGYVYLGSQLLAVQQAGVYWMHEDPVTKSKRITNSAGAIVSTVELDPWGADTNRSSNSAFQPKKFTTYERDVNGTDEAMFRRYNRWQSRFDQPDPYDGSYSLTNPQSFNRYAYVNGDPVNFTDPTGLDGDDDFGNTPDDPQVISTSTWSYRYWRGFGGGEGHEWTGANPNADLPKKPWRPERPAPENPTLAQRIKQKICSSIPSGRTVGLSGGLGLVGGPVGGGEIVINYNSGQMSAFAFGGAQVGWIGGAQGSAYTGFVYGLNNSNSNYSGGFTGGNAGALVGGFGAASSGGLTGSTRDLIPDPRGVKAGGVSVGGSLLGGINGGLNATDYTKPLQLGKNPFGLGLVDPLLYQARQVCK
jgi:RHS repeat-associated protein